MIIREPDERAGGSERDDEKRRSELKIRSNCDVIFEKSFDSKYFANQAPDCSFDSLTLAIQFDLNVTVLHA